MTIAAGTDAGNIGTLPGPSLHTELALMVQGGLSPLQVLASATIGGARVMGRSDDLGTIEKGKLADLLVLDADPRLDIHNVTRLNAVASCDVRRCEALR